MFTVIGIMFAGIAAGYLLRKIELLQKIGHRALARAAHADDAVDVAVWNGQGDVLERVYPSAGCFKGFA